MHEELRKDAVGINRASIRCKEVQVHAEKDDEAVKLRRCLQKEQLFLLFAVLAIRAWIWSIIVSRRFFLYAKYGCLSSFRVILCPAQVTPFSCSCLPFVADSETMERFDRFADLSRRGTTALISSER